MPDPLTVTAAITLAGKAVNQVSKLVQSGREIEDCMSHISRWFECCSDDQRAQLRELIMWQWGKDEWNNLLAQEKQIREKRQKLIHDRIVLKQKIFDLIIGVAGILAMLGIIIGFIWILSLGG
jgi:hypothetical protein